MSQTTTAKLRIAAVATLGASLIAATLPALASSPLLAGWVWIR